MSDKDKGVAAPKDKAKTETATELANEAAPGKDASGLMNAVEDQIAKEDAAGDVTGKLTIANFSQQALDEMSRELREVMHQVESGFGSLTAPGEIFKLDQAFYVIDAATIPDYLDQTTGEEKTKHIFTLEFPDGVVRNVMQSDARPRRVLARAFTLARQLGGGLRIGPYKYEQKAIPRQIQPAFIFAQQPGFSQRALS